MGTTEGTKTEPSPSTVFMDNNEGVPRVASLARASKKLEHKLYTAVRRNERPDHSVLSVDCSLNQ